MENSQNTFNKGCAHGHSLSYTLSQSRSKHHKNTLPRCHRNASPPHRHRNASQPHRLTATAMPHNPTASPPHRHRNASPPHRHTVGSRLGATEPLTPPCSLCPHRFHPCASPPPPCTPPHCRVAPWCDRATQPTAIRQLPPHRPPRCPPRPAALPPCTLRRCHFAHTATM